MNAKTKNILILVLIGVIGAFILFTCNGKKVEKPVVVTVEAQTKQVEKTEDKLTPVIDSFKTALIQEKEKASGLRRSLAFYQSENKRLGDALKVPDTITLPGESSEYYTQRDAISDLLANIQATDSTCNETVNNLQEQINKQADVISLKDTLYLGLRRSFNTALDQQNLQAGYIKKLEKKVKWTQVGKFGWKAAAVAGGILILKGLIR